MQVRSERPGDIEPIDRLLFAAFGQHAEGKLVKQLRSTDQFVPDLSLILESKEKLLGYLLLYPVRIETSKSNIRSLALAPMAVLPGEQNQGHGSKLINQALVVAESANWGSVIVLGHPGYYPKFGFVPASTFGVNSVFDVPDEVFMAIELTTGSLRNGGTVIYPPPFHNM